MSRVQANMDGTEAMNDLIGKRMTSWVYSDEKLALFFEDGTELEVSIDNPEMVSIQLHVTQTIPLNWCASDSK